MCADKLSKWVETIEQNGYVIIEDFFPVEQVTQAYDEIMNIYRADLTDREQKNINEAFHKTDNGKSILTKPTHLLLDVYSLSPTLDQMFEKILTDAATAKLLKTITGGDIKLRGYNCQRITGAFDPAPEVGSAPNPHEWHRDSPGELCISIFLADVVDSGKGATALIPGSHKYPFCPRWNALFGPPHHIKEANSYRSVGHFFLKYNIFSRILGKKIKKRATGAYGKRGDFYIFLNDMWHGREPGIHGTESVRLMAGAFPLHFAFPDEVPLPTEEILNKLPPALSLAAAQKEQNTEINESIIDRMLHHRSKAWQPAIFKLVQMERKIVDKILSKIV